MLEEPNFEDIGSPKTPKQSKQEKPDDLGQKELKPKKRILDRFVNRLKEIDEATNKYVGEKLPKDIEEGLKRTKGLK